MLIVMPNLRLKDGEDCSIIWRRVGKGDSPRLNLGGGSGEGTRSIPNLNLT